MKMLSKMCDTEGCIAVPASTLTVDIEGRSRPLTFIFCKECAAEVNTLLAERLGADVSQLNLYKTPIPYNVGDLQAVMEIMDARYT